MRTWYLLLVLVLMSTSAMAVPIRTPATEDEKPPEETQLEIGLQHLQAGELDRADTALRAHLARSPEDIDALMWLAELQFQSGQIDAAGELVDQVITLRPGYAPAYHALARYRYLKKDFDASEGALHKAIELDPDLFAAHIDLADHYMTVRKDPTRAIDEYRRATELRPDHAGAHYGLGVARSRTGDVRGAKAAWRKAAALDTSNPLPMYALGNMLMTQRKPDAALEAFGQALRAEPRHLPSMMARGEIYAARGDDEAALREFNAALTVEASLAPAYLKIGLIRQRQGEDRRAIEAYNHALAINDDQPLVHNNLAWLLHEDPTTQTAARRHALRATELRPEIAAYWDTLGWIQYGSGDHDAALASLSKSVELTPQPVAYEHLAQVYTAMGNAGAAEEAARMARSLRNQ